jgi:tRNA-modifying protein YgfZ
MGSLEKGADLSARLMRLPALGIMRIAGADARNFLQGQLSNDLRILTPTVSLFAAYNSPQGRVIALLRLIERDREILAILPRDLIGKVIERLRKYVLRAKVLLSDASTEFSVMGMLDLDASSAARHAIPLAELPGAHRIDRTLSSVRLAGAAPRHMLVAPESELITLDRQLSSTLDDEAWRAAAVVTGDPQIYSETSELFVAQMLNLDLIEALSFSKGCYTGQEIITRTQHLGRIKRRMLPFRLAPGAEARRGESVMVSAGRSGRVVEVARNAADGLDVLAVVPVAPLEAEGSQESPPAAGAISLPLPYPIPGADQGS